MQTVVWVTLAVAVVAAAVLGAIFLGLVRLPSSGNGSSGTGGGAPKPFSFSVPGTGTSNEHPYSICAKGGSTSGSVSFSWTANASARLEVINPSGGVAYNQQANFGSGAFGASCGTFEFVLYAAGGGSTVHATVSGEWVP